MKKKIKGLKREIYPNAHTGKLEKSFSSDEGMVFIIEKEDEDHEINVVEDNDRYLYIKTIPCSHQFDNPEVIAETTKVFNKAKFSCAVDLEISLSASPDLHEHRIHRLTNSNVPDLETNPLFVDFGEHQCGIYFKLNHQITTKSTQKDIIKNDLEGLEKLNKINAEISKITGFGQYEINKQHLAEYKRTFDRMNKYVKANLADELERVVNRLILEFYASEERGEEREDNISIILNKEDKELRKRLTAPKGRVPVKERADYESEKEQFINQCFETIKQYHGNPSRTALAKGIFKKGENPLLALRRRLKNLGLTYEGILQKYSEQKSS